MENLEWAEKAVIVVNWSLNPEQLPKIELFMF